MKSIKIPVVAKLLVPLISGILVSYFLKFNVAFAFTVAFGVLTILFGLFNQRRFYTKLIFEGCLFFLFFCFGNHLENKSNSIAQENYFTNFIQKDSLNVYQLKIIEPTNEKENWIKCKSEIVSVNNHLCEGNVLIYFEKDSLSESLNYGDCIVATANFFPINPPLNPHEFDYKKYLFFNDIHHQAFVKQGNWIKKENQGNSIMSFIYSIRNYSHTVIDNSGMSTDNKSVAKALLLGDKQLVDKDLLLSFAGAGALHVLAVSGLHVGIVMLILSFILRPIKRFKSGKLIFLILAVSGVWFYAIITGMSPSVLRAAVMFSFILIGNELQRDTSIYQSLMVSAAVLILIDPHIIFKVGFLLSYFAVIGIVYFYPKIYGLFYFRYKIFNYAWSIMAVSIAAQIATFPLSIYCFQQFPNLFIISNLLVIPLSFALLIIGIAYLVFATVPILGDALLFMLNLCLDILNGSVRWIENIPYSTIQGISIRWYDVILLYATVFLVMLSFELKAKKLFFSSLLILTFFTANHFIQKINLNQQNIVTIYSIKNEIGIDIFTNNQTKFISTNFLVNDKDKLAFHVYPNRYYNRGKSNISENIILSDSSTIISVNNQSICFISQQDLDTKYYNKFPLVDCIYFHDLGFIPPYFLNAIIETKTKLILGYGIKYSAKKFLKSKLNWNQYYDLTRAGAISIEM